MKIDIQEQLQKHTNKDKELISFDAVKEVKLLLEGDSLEDARILRHLSNNAEFSRMERVHGRHLELENLETMYDGMVFTYQNIEKLAIDYNLRFLETRYYNGAFDIEVVAKLKEFSKKNNLSLNEWDLKNNYFILAPEEMFTLKEDRYISKKEKDPAIFYKIDDTHYRLIHKWGADFTIFRYLSGYRWKGYIQHWIFNTLITSPISALFWGLVLPMTFLTQLWFLVPLLIIGTSGLFAYLRWGWGKIDEFDVIDSFFSPTKWNSTTKINR